MTSAAAPQAPGRRTGFGMVALMAIYLVAAPPLFLLGPLLLLLLLSSPRTRREWLWIVLAGAATLVVVRQREATGVVNSLLISGAAMTAGAYAVLTHAFRGWSMSGRVLVAVALATLGVLGWSLAMGVRIELVDGTVRAELQRALDLMMENAAPEQHQAAEASADLLTWVFPAVTMLQATAGLALAGSWYHEVAATPVGDAPGRFRDFKFNDHLVWGAIFTLAAAVLTPPEPWARLVTNALVVWVGLYVARGLAVAIAVAARWPAPTRLLALAAAVLAFPFATAGLVTVGLMDTWIDFRGRLASQNVGGES